MTTNFYKKYLKYKLKYLQLKKEYENQNHLVGGAIDEEINKILNNNTIKQIYNLYKKYNYENKNKKTQFPIQPYVDKPNITENNLIVLLAENILTYKYYDNTDKELKTGSQKNISPYPDYLKVNLCDHPVVKCINGDITYVTLNTNSSVNIENGVKNSLEKFNKKIFGGSLADKEMSDFAKLVVNFRNLVLVKKINNMIKTKTTQKIIINLQETDIYLHECLTNNLIGDEKISNFVPQNLISYSVKSSSGTLSNSELVDIFKSKKYEIGTNFEEYSKAEEHGFITICSGFGEIGLTTIPLCVSSKIACWTNKNDNTIGSSLIIGCRAIYVKELNIVNAHLFGDNYSYEQFHQLINCEEQITFNGIKIQSGLVNLAKINNDYSIGDSFKSIAKLIITDETEANAEYEKIKAKINLFVDTYVKTLSRPFNGSEIGSYDCDKLVVVGDFNIAPYDIKDSQGKTITKDRELRVKVFSELNNLQDNLVTIDEAKRKKYYFWYENLDFIVIPELLISSQNTTQAPKKIIVQTLRAFSKKLNDGEKIYLKIKNNLQRDLKWKFGNNEEKKFPLKNNMLISLQLWNGSYKLVFYENKIYYNYKLPHTEHLWEEEFISNN